MKRRLPLLSMIAAVFAAAGASIGYVHCTPKKTYNPF